MRIYDIAFYVVVFFLLGILAASLKIDFIIIVLAAVLVAAIFLFSTYFQSYEVQPRKIERKLFWFAGLSLFIIVGALYYFVDDYRSRNINITFDQKISFEGIVTRNPAREIGRASCRERV